CGIAARLPVLVDVVVELPCEIEAGGAWLGPGQRGTAHPLQAAHPPGGVLGSLRPRHVAPGGAAPGRPLLLPAPPAPRRSPLRAPGDARRPGDPRAHLGAPRGLETIAGRPIALLPATLHF